MRSPLLYFSLRGPKSDPALAASLGEEERKVPEMWLTLALYLGTVAGVAGKLLLQTIDAGSITAQALGFMLLRGAIIGCVLLPLVYKRARLHRIKLKGMHFFISFQNGFFWETLMETLANQATQ